MNPPVALTIAGSDPSGGAGVQADLKTFAALGVYGASVVTALTAQNTTGVRAVHIPPVEFLQDQLEAVLCDLPIGAVKTGMLANAAIVAAVGRHAAAGTLPNLVVDPVMVASSGDRLLEAAAEAAYLDLLFPYAVVITPNVHEAGLLVGRTLHSVDDLADAARELHRSGPAFVVVKGGDLPISGGAGSEDHYGYAVDVVFDGRTIELLRAELVPTANSHGTGCTFSAAIAARLGSGCDPRTAIRDAKDYVSLALRRGSTWRLGAGRGPVGHFGHLDTFADMTDTPAAAAAAGGPIPLRGRMTTTTTTVAFHKHLRAQAQDVWDAIFAHPFLAELGDGTLPEDRFLFFVRQDYLYLADFARAICLAGAKADDLDTLEIFATHATSVVAVERNLHSNWSARLGVSPEELTAGSRAPITQAYTQHLLAVAHSGSLAETVAALLPCYWIYWEVGKRLASRLPDHPIYAEWIRAYTGEGFAEHVQQQLRLMDRLALTATEVQRTRLEEHFTQSSRYEYLFWDQAYHQRTWTV